MKNENLSVTITLVHFYSNFYLMPSKDTDKRFQDLKVRSSLKVRSKIYRIYEMYNHIPISRSPRKQLFFPFASWDANVHLLPDSTASFSSLETTAYVSFFRLSPFTSRISVSKLETRHLSSGKWKEEQRWLCTTSLQV